MGGTARQAGRTACIAVAIAAIAMVVLARGASSATEPPSPWNGVNPFHCRLQNAGQGTKVPDPGADPYCVQFDKSHQNVTELGMVKFLLDEPARFAAAGPKCFYFQADHWRGSVIQSNGATLLYEFYGHYFFNKATGDGGLWVNHFAIAGRTFDPRTLPGFPHRYDKYFGPGRGGMITHNDVHVDPSCKARSRLALPGITLGLPVG